MAIGSLVLTGCSGGSASAETQTASAAALAGEQKSANNNQQNYADTGVVVRVIDGDTIAATVNGEEKTIRLLNIDTPETKHPNEPIQCLGPEATAYLESRLEPGDEIGLEYDIERLDRYGRTLAGVYESNSLVNADIAAMGLGVAVLFEPNKRFYQQVLDAQNKAKDQLQGLFNPAIECTLPGQLAGPLAPLTEPPVDPADIAGTIAALASLNAAIASGNKLLGLIGKVVPNIDAKNGPLYWVHQALKGTDSKNLEKALEQAREKRVNLDAKLTQLKSAEQAMKDEAERKAAAAEASRKAEQAEANRKAAQAEAERKSAQAEATRKAAKAEAARKSAQAEAARKAAKAEAARKAAVAEANRKAAARAEAQRKARQQQQQKPKKSSSNPYPGYTGPRCYAPGGQTWKPCP
ncbi:thermonuclease family protein [Neomicrococcus lactis]|uniref:Micrococcal nuclease n=1 Tax=Neomicrococcus lactis TaxID=732241 RepID=A0A7W8YAG3_9MICC|nr:thermonuclease family protein [Neomicrococcus lactis]MBB5597930.1 micrococcal nuclease [Neomicrococcus lactis]